jgi:hypothetical protein
MKLLFLLCCEQAVVDGPSNRLTLLNVAEELNVATLPVAVPQITVVGLFLKEKKSESDKIDVLIRCTLNNVEIFKTAMTGLSFQRKMRTRMLAGFQGIPITSAGTLTFSLLHKNKILAEWPIQINDARQTLTAAVVPAISSGTALPKQRQRGRPRRKR